MRTGKLQTLVLYGALVAYISGCGGPPRVPVDSVGAKNGNRSIEFLSVGDHVRLEMNSGEVIEGRVERISSETATIGRVTNYGYEESTIELADICSVEGESFKWAAFKAFFLLTVVAVLLTLGNMYGAAQ